MDVVRAGWLASGAPDPEAAALGPRARCARCGVEDELVPVKSVVSRAFTGHDGWTGEGQGLCRACTWGYRTACLRKRIHLVTRDPLGIRELTPGALRDELQQPLPADVALSVPTGLHRTKHVLPASAWGRVTLVDTPLTWSAADAERLDVVEDLLRHGCHASALQDAVPPWRALSSLPTAERVRLMREWGRLDPWRVRRPWLDLARAAMAGRAHETR